MSHTCGLCHKFKHVQFCEHFIKEITNLPLMHCWVIIGTYLVYFLCASLTQQCTWEHLLFLQYNSYMYSTVPQPIQTPGIYLGLIWSTMLVSWTVKHNFLVGIAFSNLIYMYFVTIILAKMAEVFHLKMVNTFIDTEWIHWFKLWKLKLII